MRGTTAMLVMCMVLLLGVLLAPVSALSCYRCASVINYGCNNPFNSTTIETCNSGTHCFTNKTESSPGSIVVLRGCLTVPGVTNRCESSTIDGAEQEFCVCNRDFCNAAHRLSISAIVVTMILLFVFLIGQFSNQ